MTIELERLLLPLFDTGERTKPNKAKQLTLELCSVETARSLIKAWHSRLPVTQAAPWQFAFGAHHENVIYGVALWNNPSARTLPAHWLELRRLAIAPDAPHCAASWMLGAMVKWFKQNCPDRERAISYQDNEVHTGTIYKAAGWVAAYQSKPRVRDRSTKRPSGRMYRNNINGQAPDGAGKTRWEITL